MGKKLGVFWQRIVSSQYKEDAKVVVMVVMAMHFIITSFLATFFLFYLALYTAKGSINKDLLDLLGEILKNDFWIIIAGFGFISSVDFGQAMIQRAAAIAKGPANITMENVEAFNTEQVTNIKPDNPDA